MAVSIHPSVDKGVKKGKDNFAGGTLTCKCAKDPVEITLKGQTALNHACGCTKCWKPDGALFSVVAVVPRDKLSVTSQRRQAQDRRREGHDPAPCLHRNAACTCMAASRTTSIRSMASISSTPNFRRMRAGRRPTFAAFVSSIIESGAEPKKMGAVRGRLKELGLEPYDCLSPPIMDLIATHVAKASGALKA